MRILQVITDTDRRGAQVFATDLGGALQARGHDVDTVALAPGTNPSGRLDLHVLGPTRLGRSTISALRHRARSADVVVAHGSSTLDACVLARFGRGGTPFVYRQISDSVFWANTWLRRLRVGFNLRRANGIVALSDGARNTLVTHVKAPNKRISVVPNGVPATGFAAATDDERRKARLELGLDPNHPVVLYIGALVPEKGADAAIHALATSAAAELGAQLLVVGDGPERAHLESLAADILADRVRFTGSLPQALVAYHAADLVVLPSRGGDSMPATLIEAGFCGLAAATTPVGSIADVVDDGVTGFVTPIDDDEAFTDAVAELLTDEERRHQMGAAARQRCLAQFEIGVVAEVWEQALVSAARRA